MARIDTGNNLSAAVQQPGAKVSDDGYGLLTCTVVWKQAIASAYSSVTNRGGTCPVAATGTMKSHKWSVVEDALGIATITVDYIGIDSGVNGGTRTNPQVTGSQGLTSENIITHPNFFELATGFSGSPIAGVGSGTISAPVYTSTAGSNNTTEYVGTNGATFEKQSGGKFLGFKVPQYKGFYGKSNYLAPQTSFSGHFYTTSSSTVQGMLSRVGKTSGSGAFNSIDLLPSYMGSSFTVGGKNQLLLAQVNTEDYGLLYKVQYEVRYNREGYESAVYAAN
jgi:hypothetical protein